MKQYEHIKLRRGDREKITNLIDIDRTTLSKAMRFEANSLRAREARRIAVNILHCHLYVSKKREII